MSFAKPKRKPGRPKGITAYKPEFIDLAARAYAAGFTDREVATFLGVGEVTLNRWKIDHPEFLEALKMGKYPADERVTTSLYHRAVGYSFNSEKVFCHQGEVTRVAIVEHVPPDVTAQIFWLKNRRPKEWRDRQENVNFDVHLSLADLVNQSYQEPKLVEGKEVKDD